MPCSLMFRQSHQNLFSDIVRSKARLQVASQTKVERHVPILESDDKIPTLGRDDKILPLERDDRIPALERDDRIPALERYDKIPALGKDYHISRGQPQQR